jgi:hypothetical protein
VSLQRGKPVASGSDKPLASAEKISWTRLLVFLAERPFHRAKAR